MLDWYGEDSNILRFYAVMTGKYVTACRGKYIVYVLWPNRSRIKVYIARFEGLPFELLKILRWASRVARMGEGRGVHRWGNLREGDRLGDPDLDGRITLRRTFRKWEGGLGSGWSWFRIGTGGGHL